MAQELQQILQDVWTNHLQTVICDLEEGRKEVWSLMDALHPTIKRFQDVNKTMLQSTSIKFNIKFSTKQ